MRNRSWYIQGKSLQKGNQIYIDLVSYFESFDQILGCSELSLRNGINFSNAKVGKLRSYVRDDKITRIMEEGKHRIIVHYFLCKMAQYYRFLSIS